MKEELGDHEAADAGEDDGRVRSLDGVGRADAEAADGQQRDRRKDEQTCHILSQQQADGSFKPDEAYLHQESWGRIQNSSLPPTAYVTWALAHSNCTEPGVSKAVQYVRNHWKDAKEPYTLAVAANALVSADQVLAKGDLDDATISLLEQIAAIRELL